MAREAIILAGGLGTRLRSVVPDLPKPMAQVVDQPFLHYVFRYLRHFKVERAILSVGYRHEPILEFLGNRYLDIAVEYAVEETPLGTGGGIRLALNKVVADAALVLNGDTFFDVDLDAFYRVFWENKADVALALRSIPRPDRFGTVSFDADYRITAFREKEVGLAQGYINGGVYLFRPSVMEEMGLPEKFSIEQDFFEPKVNQLRCWAYPDEGYFIDIGIPEEYQRANDEFAGFRY
ncbi:MAG: nucleotidyltransferase family protein [Bacteroidota bacterium]